MADSRKQKEGHVDRFGCPIAGHDVMVTSKYARGEAGEDRLSYFACTLEGRCGITMWDPCPLYVRCLENKVREEDE